MGTLLNCKKLCSGSGVATDSLRNNDAPQNATSSCWQAESGTQPRPGSTLVVGSAIQSYLIYPRRAISESP